MKNRQKAIRISCRGSSTAELDELCDFQGSLKSLSEENYRKLADQIAAHGFSFPFHVWTDPKGKKNLIDGHQRKLVLTRMREEGFHVPPLPIDSIEADSLQEAKKKVLAAAAQYGKVEGEGLYRFMTENEIRFEDLEFTPLPEINIESFKAEYFTEEDVGGGAKNTEGAKELSQDDFTHFKLQCPRCGFSITRDKDSVEAR